MQIETEYEIGDFVYTIDGCTTEEWKNAEYKKENFKYRNNFLDFSSEEDVIIKANKVEGFIIDNEGKIHPAVDGWDGWNKITTYSSCNNVIYKSIQDAKNDLYKG